MQVNSLVSASASATSSTANRRPEQIVQDVFSNVLAAAGREGYQTAAPLTGDQPVTAQISDSWSRWFDVQRVNGRYRSVEDTEQLKTAYGEIMLRAYDQGGYAAPQQFLASLSEVDLDIVQEIHYLADPIQVAGLSDEGALNLLLPPPAQIDANHDGFTRCGACLGYAAFPSSNTPPEVVAAWDEATADLEPQERMIYELQMMLPLLTANIVCDADGRFVCHYEPGDPEFTNPLDSAAYSYRGAAQDHLDYLELFRYQMSPQRYEGDKAFWEKFLEQLTQQNAN